jgi:hypothetical protein
MSSHLFAPVALCLGVIALDLSQRDLPSAANGFSRFCRCIYFTNHTLTGQRGFLAFDLKAARQPRVVDSRTAPSFMPPPALCLGVSRCLGVRTRRPLGRSGKGLSLRCWVYSTHRGLTGNLKLRWVLPCLLAGLSTIESLKCPCNGTSSSSLRISSYARWETRLARGSPSRRVRNGWNRSAASMVRPSRENRARSRLSSRGAFCMGGTSSAICRRRSCPTLSAIACCPRDRRPQVHPLRRQAFVGSPRTCSKNDCASFAS